MCIRDSAKSPHDALFFHYKKTELQAVRSGRWKLILPHSYRTLGDREGGTGGIPVDYDSAKAGTELYDLRKDIGETKDVSADHPEVVAELMKKVESMRAELGDSRTKTKGKARRLPTPVE